MIRKLIAIFLSLALCWTTVACSSPTSTQSQSSNNTSASVTPPNQVKEGRYPVQQAEYDDTEGTYTLMLLNTPPGKPPTYRTQNLQMARLTEEQVKNGESTYLEVTGEQAVMHLTEDFKIEYVHNVTETQTNPQTGQPQTVVVRRESNFWAPFAGALAGQALGSLLFTPQYYFPPMYQPGGIMRGYGGYGNTYTQASQSYQSKYNAPPPAVKNKQTLRTTGNLNRSSSSSATSRQKSSPNAPKSSGSGFGSSNLKNSGTSRSNVQRNSGFGSSKGSSSRSRSSRRR
ncbi:hypothetical protein VB715_16315 [Crocosphaera sp. UHCC 0190]|uniref:hypothetical protein n=1 Tax=Crocosphaera sp. UHCC 0190 TaxID=3110246 RepID=UPI002B205CCB|nr:hypothetical protein [Crocosphaera sp. UHCC 0190]MEA5511339.1 hypothetical protein [Crocosphaera sp. UHCC 0190]